MTAAAKGLLAAANIVGDMTVVVVLARASGFYAAVKGLRGWRRVLFGVVLPLPLGIAGTVVLDQLDPPFFVPGLALCVATVALFASQSSLDEQRRSAQADE